MHLSYMYVKKKQLFFQKHIYHVYTTRCSGFEYYIMY